MDPRHPPFQGISVLAGFDAFVDRIYEVVQERSQPERFVRMEQMHAFAQFVQRAAGHSANVERVLRQTKAGGNAALFSLCAAQLGAKVEALVPVGVPQIDPVFLQGSTMVQWTSLGQPGRTDALEFLDGKLMINEMGDVADMGWNHVQTSLGADSLVRKIRESQLIMLGNWTMNLGMHSIFSGLLRMDFHNFTGHFFIDIADPQKRSRADLREALQQIQDLSSRAQLMLGLNCSEADQVLQVLGHPGGVEDQPESLLRTVKGLSAILGCGVVVHGLRHAATAGSGGVSVTAGPYCENPLVTTGAGDHFNAGFALAWAAGLDVYDTLRCGVNCSGFYVRNGRAPTWSELWSTSIHSHSAQFGCKDA